MLTPFSASVSIIIDIYRCSGVNLTPFISLQSSARIFIHILFVLIEVSTVLRSVQISMDNLVRFHDFAQKVFTMESCDHINLLQGIVQLHGPSQQQKLMVELEGIKALQQINYNRIDHVRGRHRAVLDGLPSLQPSVHTLQAET